jgi:hypothetical protein
MNSYLLAAVAIIGFLLYIHQTALGSFVRLQKTTSSKIMDFLRQNRLKSLLEVLTVFAALACFLGEYVSEWISDAAIIVGILSLWGLARICWMESNPYHLLKGYQDKAFDAVSQTNEPAICDWIEAIQEVALKALHKSETPLVSAALDSQLQIGKNFLSAPNTLDLSKIGYVMFFLYERLKVLFEKGLSEKQEPVCMQIITTYGKLALHSMGTHPHFAGYALTFIGDLAEKGVKLGMREIGVKTGLMLIELTKSVANDISLDEYDLREPLLGIVKNLEEISSELYRQDKTMPIDVIKEPFLQLKTVLVSSKSSDHPTIVMVICDIDRVLAQFQELELILKTIPSIG